ncbi:uncharacterized protein [Antedon mediterranea]|uniref:uncharacterized protein n=1 Tax=Antedon mediterranea TaxID=105859 RepID=UPI003AF921C3
MIKGNLSRMPGVRTNRRLCLMGLIMVTLALYGWIKLFMMTLNYDFHPKLASITDMKLFTTELKHSHDWYHKVCFNGLRQEFSISRLEDFQERWKVSSQLDCRVTYDMFERIYDVKRRSGQIVVPDTFQTKLLKWLGNSEDLLREAKLQFITIIYNKYTNEETIFNPLRAKRPGVNDQDDVETYLDELMQKSSKDCDFCAYEFKTAEDTFGRITSTYSGTAANAFKYNGYHSLIISKKHNFLELTEEEFIDMMHTSMRWYMKVYETDKRYKYPQMMWDSLPKASASQVHTHAQASISPDGYYGLMKHIHLSATKYAKENGGCNYFTDLLQVHNALGLATNFGNASAMAYLTPKNDNEVVIMSRTANSDFFRLLYFVLKAFTEDMKQYAWSLAMFLPKLEPWVAPGIDDIPALVRIVSRGPVNNPRSDISSMELFGASNVNIDPFNVIQYIEDSVRKRSVIKLKKENEQTKEELKEELKDLEKENLEKKPEDVQKIESQEKSKELREINLVNENK